MHPTDTPATPETRPKRPTTRAEHNNPGGIRPTPGRGLLAWWDRGVPGEGSRSRGARSARGFVENGAVRNWPCVYPYAREVPREGWVTG